VVLLSLTIYFLKHETVKNLNLPEEVLDAKIRLDGKEYGIVVCGSPDGSYPDLEEILRLFYPKTKAREIAGKIEKEAEKTTVW